MGLGIRGFPMLALLAVSQFAAPMRSAPREVPRAAPPAPETSPAEASRAEERSHDDAPAPRAAISRERSVALLLLLGDAAARGRVK